MRASRAEGWIRGGLLQRSSERGSRDFSLQPGTSIPSPDPVSRYQPSAAAGTIVYRVYRAVGFHVSGGFALVSI